MIPSACNFKKPLQSNENSIITSPTPLFDSVELFPEGQNTLSLNIPFQKNWIYYFSFESYVPFSDIFLMDLYCQTPSSRNYHFFDYNGSIENNVRKIFFEYGSAESGDHIINIMVNTSQNINIHVYIEEYMLLDDYYAKNILSSINRSDYYCDIYRYGINQETKEYTFSVYDDTEYKFNFFRVNPISLQDRINNGYQNPFVRMTLSLNGTEYTYYRDIPTLNYSLYGNIPYSDGDSWLFDSGRDLNNKTFEERFGAHCSGDLTITISMVDIYPFDHNFAFLVWSVGDIGNGTDGIDPTNSTFPNPFDNSNDSNTDLYNSGKDLTTVMDEWIAITGLFFQKNWWPILLGLVVVLMISTIVGKYGTAWKSRIALVKEHRESIGNLGRG